MPFQTGEENKSKLLMDTRFKAIITKNSPKLEYLINIVRLAPWLTANGVMQELDLQLLETPDANFLQVRKLLQHIQRGDVGRFEGFLDALWETGQNVVVTEIFGLSSVIPDTVTASVTSASTAEQAQASASHVAAQAIIGSTFGDIGGDLNVNVTVTQGAALAPNGSQGQGPPKQSSSISGLKTNPQIRFKDFEDDLLLSQDDAEPVNEFFEDITPTLVKNISFAATFWASLRKQKVIEKNQREVIQDKPGNQAKADALLQEIRTVGHLRKLLWCLCEDKQEFILSNIGITKENICRET